MKMRSFVPCVVLAALLLTSGSARAADLDITSSTAPYSGSTAYAGASFTLQYTVKNLGTAFSTNFRNYFYYCTTQSAATCTYLTYVNVNDNFAAGQSRTYYQTLTVPKYAVHGLGFIRTYVDGYNAANGGHVKETNEGNNDDYDDITVGTRPDLYFLPQYTYVPYTGSTAAVGSSFTGYYYIYNKANTSKLTADFYVHYYYCPGQTPAGCISLGAQSINTDINSGSNIKVKTIALAIPAAAQNGKGYIRAHVDSTDAIVESNETNNNDYDEILVTDNPADLLVPTITAPYSGSSAYTGASFTARYVLQNSTKAKYNLNRDFRVYFYWCTSQTASACTYMTYTTVKDDFLIGQARTYYQTLTVPVTATYGDSWIRVVADGQNAPTGGVVKESNETNNDRYAKVTVTTRPDLYFNPTYTYVPYTGSTAGVGSSFTAYYYIYNATKTSKLTDDFSIRYYYCQTQSASTCTHMATQFVTNDINSGSYLKLKSISLSIPSKAQNGTRYVMTVLDYDNKVKESNESNNTDFDAITVSGVATDLRVLKSTVPVSGSTAYSGSSFTAQYTLHNDSGSALVANFYNYFYWCSTKTYSASTCVYMGNKSVADDFLAGQSRIYYQTLTVPTSAVYGAAYLLIRADATNTVKETNDNNNDHYATVTVSTRPDLYFNAKYTYVPYTGSTAGVGSSFTGYYYIYNKSQSSRLTDNFFIRYYYCTAMSSSTCTSIGTQYVTTDINSGTYLKLKTLSLAIPTSATNGKRYIRAYLDHDNKVKETNESNNEDYDEITVSSVPTDLMITTTKAPYSGSTKNVGSSFTVSYTLRNDSNSTLVTNFYTYFYYCPTKSYSTSACTYLTYATISDDFNAGQSRPYYHTLTVPTTAVAGTGYIYFSADHTNLVKEKNDSNNTAWDDITVSTQPDLYINYSQVPYTGATSGPGSTFTGRFRIYNKASTSKLTKDFNIRYEYCPNKSTTGCTTIATELVTTDLKAGSYFYHKSITLSMPAMVQNGTRYIRAYLDHDNKVIESNEANNEWYDAISVTKAPGDLTISSTKAPNSGSTAGAGSKFSVLTNVTNTTTMTVTSNFYIYYYYCPTKSYSASACTYLTNTYVTDNFSSKQSRPYAQNLTVPSSAGYGKGYIYFLLDATKAVTETNENNNTYWDDITVSTLPDLYVSSSAVPYTGGTSTIGSTFTGRYRIYNKASTSRLTKDFNIRYYYCPGVSTTGCITLGTQQVSTNLNAGGNTYVQSISLSVPSGAKAGTAYIRAFLDYDGKVAESDETNNNDYDSISVLFGDPDLTVSSVKAPATGTTAAAGDSFTVEAVLKNASSTKFSTNFVVYFYYCTTVSATSCVKLGSQHVTTDFAANASHTVNSPSLTLPDMAVHGTGYVQVYADATNVVKEAAESNNTLFDKISVTTAPDLSVTASKVPFTGSTAKPGDSFTGQYTVTNGAKTSALTTDFYVAFFYCTNNSVANCVQIGQQTVSKDMISGASFSFTSLALKLPSSATSGTRYVRVMVDTTNQVAESNETNNDKFDPITVTYGGDPDLGVSALTAIPKGNSVDYSVTVCNNGNSTSQPFDVELYFNNSLPPDCATKEDHQWVINGLAKNGCTTRTLSRPNVKPGLYLAWARVDADCAVKETDENNNNKSAGYNVAAVADMGPEAGPDAGVEAGVEAGPAEAGVEAGPTEAGPTEAGPTEAGPTEAGPTEAGPTEAGTTEAGPDEAGPSEAGPGEAGPTEAGPTGDGAGEAGAPDSSGPGVEAGTNKDGGGGTPPAEDDGCSCRVGHTPASGATGLLLLLGLALLARRRRR